MWSIGKYRKENDMRQKYGWHCKPLGRRYEVMKNYSVRLCEADYEYVLSVMPGKSFSFCLRTLIAEHAAAYAGDEDTPE